MHTSTDDARKIITANRQKIPLPTSALELANVHQIYSFLTSGRLQTFAWGPHLTNHIKLETVRIYTNMQLEIFHNCFDAAWTLKYGQGH